MHELATKADALGREVRQLDAKIEAQGRELHQVDAKIDAQGRELRQAMADLTARVDAGFTARKQDEDLTLREIDALRARFNRLERRVTSLEEDRA